MSAKNNKIQNKILDFIMCRINGCIFTVKINKQDELVFEKGTNFKKSSWSKQEQKQQQSRIIYRAGFHLS